jgi:hypothetical protein
LTSNQPKCTRTAELLSRQAPLARPYPCLVLQGKYVALAARFYRNEKSRKFGPRIHVYRSRPENAPCDVLPSRQSAADWQPPAQQGNFDWYTRATREARPVVAPETLLFDLERP